MTPRITVVGSVNLDLVATGPVLPAPGQTVTGARLARHAGGKGANQALAARRLGASVRLLARVGADAAADDALALLRAEGVDLSGLQIDPAEPTGVALIAVDGTGENQIVVAPGANAAFGPEHLPSTIDSALICQLESPIETVCTAVARATGFVCLNLAPACDVPAALLRRADLLVVNQREAAFYGDRLADAPGLLAATLGGEGARLTRGGQWLASATPPTVEVVDTTGAGDAFVAALVVALIEKRSPGAAMRFACAAGALATTRAGAQSSLPHRRTVDALLDD